MNFQLFLSIFILIAFQSFFIFGQSPNNSSSLSLENCTTNYDCPANQSCDFDLKKCLCNYGLKLNNESECESFKCFSSQNCTDNYGDFSECVNSTCKCLDTFDVDPENQQCNKRIGTPCNTDLECGVNAGCHGKDDKICRCLFNNYVNNDLFNCDLLPCLDDRQCQYHFGRLTHCRRPTNPKIPSKCGCPSPVGYVFDDEQQTCLVQKITRECSVSADCGPYSTCLNSTCSCQFGYVFNQTGACRALHCLNDFECTQAFSNSLCSRKLHCQCDREHYELDSSEMMCAKKKYPFVPYVIVSVIGVMVAGPIVWFIGKNACFK